MESQKSALSMEKELTIEDYDRINDIIDQFDFDRVRTVMLALDWQWFGSYNGCVPEVYQLKHAARQLLKEVIKSEWKHIERGGFIAENVEGILKLWFYIYQVEEVKE